MKQRSCYEGRSYPLPLYIRRIPGIRYYVKSPAAEFFEIRFNKEKSLLVTGGNETKELCIIELRLRARSSAQSKYTIVSFFNIVNT